MSPLEIMEQEKWMGLLQEMAGETLMATALMDDQGAMLLIHGERYPICDTIRANEDSLVSICSQSNAGMLAQIRQTLTPLVEECEAGMMRIVIPVVHDGELIGQVASCGRVPEGGAVETFLVSKALGIEEQEAVQLASKSPSMTESDARSLADRFFARVGELTGSA